MNRIGIDVGTLPDEAVQAFANTRCVPLSLVMLTVFLMFIAGTFLLLKPDMVWNLQHLWTVENGEPTYFFLVSTRIMGIFFVILSIIVVFMTITGQ